MNQLTYLQSYPGHLLPQVRTLTAEQRLGTVLEKHYPGAYDFATDRALWQYTQNLKDQFLRDVPPLNKVICDNKIHVSNNALGLYTAISHMQGGKLKARAEIRTATVFRSALEPFLRMIVVHELAHLKEEEHDKAFYQLCCHMEPRYYQLGFDTCLWLTQQSLRQTAQSRTGFVFRAC